MVLNDILPEPEFRYGLGRSYFSYLFEPLTFDALALVHLSETPTDELSRRIEKRARSFHEAGKPVFWLDQMNKFNSDDFQDYEYVRRVAIPLQDFATGDNVRKISETLGKPPEEVAIAFGGIYAAACVDAHLVTMCRRTYTLHPRNDIRYRLDFVIALINQPLANQPLGSGVVLDDIVEIDCTPLPMNDMSTYRGNELQLKEIKTRLKQAQTYKDLNLLKDMRRVYQSLARESNNDSFKYWCLLELMHGVGFPGFHTPKPNLDSEMLYNALREIGWHRAALVVAHGAGLKHEEDELRDLLKLTDSLDAGTALKHWNLGTDPKLVAEDLIQLGDFRKAALTAARFGGYHLAYEMATRINESQIS